MYIARMKKIIILFLFSILFQSCFSYRTVDFDDIVKCTLMLANIDDWKIASDTYKKFFNKLPTRSAFATSGLALGAKLKIECIAEL